MPLDDNLSAYYAFVADANDSHSGAHHLTEVGTPTYPADYVKLDGGTDLLHVASHTDLQLHGDLTTGNDWSACFFASVDSIAAFSIFLSKWGASSPGQEYAIRWNSSSTLFDFVTRDASSGTGQVDATTFGATTNGTRCFIAAGWRKATNVMWISINAGAIDTSPGAASGVGEGTYRMEVGDSVQALSSPMNGRIEKLMIFQRDISADVSDLYNAGAGLTYDELTGGGGGGVVQPIGPMSFNRGFN